MIFKKQTKFVKKIGASRDAEFLETLFGARPLTEFLETLFRANPRPEFLESVFWLEIFGWLQLVSVQYGQSRSFPTGNSVKKRLQIYVNPRSFCFCNWMRKTKNPRNVVSQLDFRKKKTTRDLRKSQIVFCMTF